MNASGDEVGRGGREVGGDGAAVEVRSGDAAVDGTVDVAAEVTAAVRTLAEQVARTWRTGIDALLGEGVAAAEVAVAQDGMLTTVPAPAAAPLMERTASTGSKSRAVFGVAEPSLQTVESSPPHPCASSAATSPQTAIPLPETSMLLPQIPDPQRPLPSGGPAALDASVRGAFTPVIPDTGLGPSVLEALLTHLPEHTVRPAHPHTVGHLHCPPDPVAIAADRLISALNPSQDSWDQSAATTVIESCVIESFSELAFGAPGAGSITSGGTESNHLALLLARDRAIARHFDIDARQLGIPSSAVGRVRILASAVAHFSIARAAAQLGLGEQAVIPVPVDAAHRIIPEELARAAERITAAGGVLAAVVATAGTTDAGAIDPLAACADVARAHEAWFHVDAAYGGGLLLSDVRRPMLAGIELADSASVDLHKLGWQPIPAGMLLTRDPRALDPLVRGVAYLSDPDDEEAGLPNLLGRSLRTTRRADAVKILAACRHHGRDGYTRMIESCFAQAAHAAAAIEAHPAFELALPPALTTVLFRYRAAHGDPDQVNAQLRRKLLTDGTAVVGRTRLHRPGDRPGKPGSVWLKLTLLRPQTTPEDLDALLALVADAGAACDLPGT